MKQLALRLGQRLLLLIGVSLCTFALLSAAPGNFFDDLKLNPQISSATVSALQAQYGANRPFPERYARWVESIFCGDWGYSLPNQAADRAVIRERVSPVTTKDGFNPARVAFGERPIRTVLRLQSRDCCRRNLWIELEVVEKISGRSRE